MGPRVLEFERSFAKYVGARHAIAVVNGTAALHAALLAAEVGPGDEVIVPSFTFVGAVNAVVLAGATPVFADIDKDTFCLRTDSIEEVVTRKTKAIIPTDLFGLPSDLKAATELARGKGMTVIEDAAQAHGAQYDGKRVGCVSDMTVFSFYAAKNLTTGEGGMITTDDDEHAQALRMIRSHGEQRPYSTPVHSTPFYRESNLARRGRLPETEKASRQVFSLPVHPRLGEEEMDYVAETLRKIIV